MYSPLRLFRFRGKYRSLGKGEMVVNPHKMVLERLHSVSRNWEWVPYPDAAWKSLDIIRTEKWLALKFPFALSSGTKHCRKKWQRGRVRGRTGGKEKGKDGRYLRRRK